MTTPKPMTVAEAGRKGGKAGTGASKARFAGTERARERARHAARARWAGIVRRADLTVERLFPSGYWLISTVRDGNRIHQRYGMPKREAIRDFLKAVNAK